jgi:NAD(P)-dependent dehydrogenase (short-subunit alcohol dehydrogenase family)
VLTASIASITGSADLLPYVTSKHAVSGLIRGAAMYGGRWASASMASPRHRADRLFAAAATTGRCQRHGQAGQHHPLRRAGRAEEIAAVAAFLLSDDASYMTGQIVSADGGANIVNTVRPSGGAGAWDYEAVDRNLYDHMKEGADR